MSVSRRSARIARHASRRTLGPLAISLTAAGILAALVGIAVFVGPTGAPPSAAAGRQDYIHGNAQAFTVPTGSPRAEVEAVEADPTEAEVVRDAYGATPGPETFIAGGTNRDWAALVMVYAGWPVTESNITVMMRWMRQENYEKTWWNRNNPLNIGAGGYASYTSLQQSAEVVARALTTSPGYAEIAAGFANSADTATIEYAIWASPWAGGHYAWGDHWHYTPVNVVDGPRSAWGG